MNLYSFAVLVFAICSIPIGLQILVRRKDCAGQIYFVLSLLYCVWGIGYSLCTSGNLSYSDSLIAIRISNVAAAFLPIVWLHFCLVYTDRLKGTGWIYYFLYLIPCVVSVGIFSDYFIRGMRPITEFKFYPIPGFLYNIHASIYFVVTPTGFYQLWKSIKELSGEDRKRQIRFLTIAFLGYLGGGLSFFPVYDVAVPQYGLFLLPLYPFLKAYFMGSSGLLFDEERMAQIAHKDKLAALGILTASINHEIRAPLFMMRGLAETEAKDNELSQKFLTQIDRITGIVSRLTHFAKKGVEEEAKIEQIDLKEVLADIRPLFQHQLNYQSIEYTQDIPADLPKVMADRRYLEEILFNLILNACQALKNTQKPQIKLSACVFEGHRLQTKDNRLSNLSSPSSQGARNGFGLRSSVVSSSSITIVIEDNGPGIPPDQLKNIFKPFHTTKQEGTGLGLYITKQLVEKCRGGIHVSSEVQGGTRFILTVGSVGHI